MNNNNMEQRTKELEIILNEFFTLDASSPKRKELGKQSKAKQSKTNQSYYVFLTNYKSQKDSYEHVKYYLTHTNNQYVFWFSLSIIEDKVTKSWSSLSTQEQNESKGFIFDLYLNNKLGQVIADIGRNDFHLNSQEYILNITNLVRNSQTSLRGINLLQYISEEFMTNKQVLSQQKKDQLKKLLLEQVPTIMEVLTKYLDQLFIQNAQKKLKNESSLPFHVGSPDTNTYTGSFSVETKNLTKAVFDALLSYFNWIPLNELLTSSLLDILFKYLRLEKSSIPALTCLNEILSKNCVPKEFEEFLIRIFHQIYSLMTEITSIKRILHAYNNQLSQLEESDDIIDNDMEPVESQRDLFIKDCIDIIIKITEIYPTKGLENLYPLFSQNVTSFFGKTDEMIKQGVLDHDQSINVNLVRDVTTIFQLFGSLTHQFGALFVQTFTAANFIFQKLMDMCEFCSMYSIYKYGSDWERLYIQLFTTVRSFSYWLAEYGNQVRLQPNQQADFDNNIQRLINNIIVPMFNRAVPEKIIICAGRLLMSLAAITKPLNLFTQMDSVISNIHNICAPLPPAVQSVIYASISNTILIPPSNVNLSHQWDLRRPKYSPFIKGITGPYLEIPQIPDFIDKKLYMKDEVIQRVQKVLKILTTIITSVPDSNQAKGILHDAIQDTLQVTLGLFRIYINNPDILESILDFFFTLFEALKAKVGVQFTQQTISTFLEILGGDNIKQLLMGSSETGNVIIKKLIEILTFVIQTYGHAFETLLSSIINFAMEKIYAVIINTTSPLKPLFFTLLYSILDNHWKYFFPATTTNANALMLGNTSNSNSITLNSNNNSSNLNNNNNSNNNNNNNTPAQQQFNSILVAFQTTFQQNDLYEKISQQEPVFGCSFINTFFNVLISKSQSVMAEEIINTIYHFASVNFNKFFNEFFTAFLGEKNISIEQKTLIKANFTEDKDHPTFNRHMSQFVNDFSYYTYLNS
ncbi:exportin 6 [Heterostelium album PN500]|uniref:Exportin 6 n=1 Tax=Heterostelium pallidum (strain ATCC 26659 / Pp 5 / PN500) TaxID=670386 RepID=D3B3T5_HETP5|nr:exportin 6 [Heterostelium album PN500]EFA83983.1 exportin 6 [Heterostelium album PN500]|eukprot:XP_020436100.1 exportin 6 [Heterostelium album PN500]